MPISEGNVVISKKGRDKHRVFVVLYIVDAEYAFIADGDLRKISRPKKKKSLHLSTIPVILEDVLDKYKKSTLLDSDVRKALSQVRDRFHLNDKKCSCVENTQEG